jgi:predicted phosphoribosyltransferase
MLADRLRAYEGRPDVVVLALPRGGVPVAYEVALALDAPLDVFPVRKLGVPGRAELAMGAVAAGGVRIINWGVVQALNIPAARIEAVSAAEERELARRAVAYRGTLPDFDVRDRTVILVDDGLATGSTMRAAIASLRQQLPQRLVAAIPVAAEHASADLCREVDEVVCVLTPERFHAVGEWYEHFEETTDEEVCQLLQRAADRPTIAA